MTGLGDDVEQQVSVWAESGAMALTGRPGAAPLGPPSGLVPKLNAVADAAASSAAALGASVVLDPLPILGERAALSGLSPQGTTSCGGATRLLRSRDRWVAVTLARADDVELVPAWLELDEPPEDPWTTVAEALASGPVEALVERALLLGLPIGVLPPPEQVSTDREAPGGAAAMRPVRRVAVPGPPTHPAPLAGLVVADLTALWAGPLCGALLAAAGATVIKVESASRPDGARSGPVAFFDLLNARKRSVALDLRTREGVGALRSILRGSDVVLEASRPRALEQLGVDARAVLAAGRTRVWASITGHGRDGAERDRVAFGDDAAVAGGLVVWDGDEPLFCADAVADPTSGIVAAAAVLDALTDGRRWLLDVAMARVASHLAGPTLPVLRPLGDVAPPRARPPLGAAPPLGSHTTEVLEGLRR